MNVVKKLKRILPIIICVLIVVGCSPYKKTENKKLKIVTTIFPIYDFVRAVGGEYVDIKMLIKPGSEVHSFDPSPSDIKAIYDADCFFYIGGESDEWVGSVLADVKTPSVALMENANLLFEDGEDEYDEHIWTSPDNAKKMIETICDCLKEKDNGNSSYYEKNKDSYNKKITEIEEKTKETVAKSKEKYILVADRFPFKYFTECYKLNYCAAFGGCAISTDISIKTMLRLVNEVKKHNVSYVFCTEMSNKSIANALKNDTGVEIIELHSAHNVTLDDFNNGITYLDIMERNYKALSKGLR